MASAAQLRRLVAALRTGDAAAKEAAAQALAELPRTHANVAAIAELGGAIAPLVELLRGGSADAKEHAAR